MATFGTFGYEKNGIRRAFTIRSLYDDGTLINMYYLYVYIMKFGSARFVKEMNKNPNGFQYVNFDWKNGTIYGDQWEGDAETELSSETSPYSNLWYDVDERTIYGQHREGTFEFKIPNISYYVKTNKNRKSIFDAVFNEDNRLLRWINKLTGPSFLKKCACNFYLLTKDQ